MDKYADLGKTGITRILNFEFFMVKNKKSHPELIRMAFLFILKSKSKANLYFNNLRNRFQHTDGRSVQFFFHIIFGYQ